MPVDGEVTDDDGADSDDDDSAAVVGTASPREAYVRMREEWKMEQAGDVVPLARRLAQDPDTMQVLIFKGYCAWGEAQLQVLAPCTHMRAHALTQAHAHHTQAHHFTRGESGAISTTRSFGRVGLTEGLLGAGRVGAGHVGLDARQHRRAHAQYPSRRQP